MKDVEKLQNSERCDEPKGKEHVWLCQEEGFQWCLSASRCIQATGYPNNNPSLLTLLSSVPPHQSLWWVPDSWTLSLCHWPILPALEIKAPPMLNYRAHLSSLSFQIQKVGGASTSRFNSATLSSRIRSQPRGKSVLEKEHDRQIGWVEYGGMGEKTAVKHFLVVLTKPGRSGYQWTADFEQQTAQNGLAHQPCYPEAGASQWPERTTGTQHLTACECSVEAKTRGCPPAAWMMILETRIFTLRNRIQQEAVQSPNRPKSSNLSPKILEQTWLRLFKACSRPRHPTPAVTVARPNLPP